jgi:hypothetical protein
MYMYVQYNQLTHCSLMKYFFIGKTEGDCFNTVVSISFTLRLGIRIEVKYKALLLFLIWLHPHLPCWLE